MIPRTKKEYLRQLVTEKNRTFRLLSAEERALGFRGWHERGYLPHCDYPGLVQFVTFRLWDSLPESRRGEWLHMLSIEDARIKRAKLERYLDRGIGACLLRDRRVATVAERALTHFHLDRYELLAWAVMPNHVHVLVHVWNAPLARMVQSWKTFAARHANEILGRHGRFWEPEYWDTFMRDERQERIAVRYIEQNPVKANLCRAPEDGSFGSARFRDPRTEALAWTTGARTSRSAR
jgi:REP element-mobilizing transposase RayT